MGSTAIYPVASFNIFIVYICNVPTAHASEHLHPFSGPWILSCPTVGPLRPRGFIDLVPDPTNHYMIFLCFVSSLTQF